MPILMYDYSGIYYRICWEYMHICILFSHCPSFVYNICYGCIYVWEYTEVSFCILVWIYKYCYMSLYMYYCVCFSVFIGMCLSIYIYIYIYIYILKLACGCVHIIDMFYIINIFLSHKSVYTNLLRFTCICKCIYWFILCVNSFVNVKFSPCAFWILYRYITVCMYTYKHIC